MYTKDVSAVPHQHVAARGSDSLASVTSGASAAAHAQDSRVSPGQIFGSLKDGAVNLLREASGALTRESGASSSTAAHGQLTSHTSPGQVFSAVSTRAPKPEADGSAFSAKEVGQQVLRLDA